MVLLNWGTRSRIAKGSFGPRLGREQVGRIAGSDRC